MAGSTLVGFLRFLLLISTHDWANRPLLVGPDEELDTASMRHLRVLYQEAREQHVAPAMCIIAPFHTDLSFGRRHCPSKPILHRLVVLAKRATNDVLVCSDTRSTCSARLNKWCVGQCVLTTDCCVLARSGRRCRACKSQVMVP